MEKLIENISNPFIGGIIIGIAASIMLVFTGKIAGISGIVGASIGRVEKARIWRYLFISGLIFGGFIMNFYFPRYFNYELNFSFVEIIIAGLFVGFGMRPIRTGEGLNSSTISFEADSSARYFGPC
jgi:uncharacterized membrane protein YedE/YeeE